VLGPGEFERYKLAALADVVEEVRRQFSEDYRRRRRVALLEALREERPISRRVIHVWHYQRQQSRFVG
jgi:hypothetical protein